MDKTKIEDFLLEKGITPEYKGFRPLVIAIDMYDYEMPMLSLYKKVGEQFGMSPDAIMGRIRSVLNVTKEYKNTKANNFIATSKLLIERR